VAQLSGKVRDDRAEECYSISVMYCLGEDQRRAHNRYQYQVKTGNHNPGFEIYGQSKQVICSRCTFWRCSTTYEARPVQMV